MLLATCLLDCDCPCTPSHSAAEIICVQAPRKSGSRPTRQPASSYAAALPLARNRERNRYCTPRQQLSINYLTTWCLTPSHNQQVILTQEETNTVTTLPLLSISCWHWPPQLVQTPCPAHHGEPWLRLQELFTVAQKLCWCSQSGSGETPTSATRHTARAGYKCQAAHLWRAHSTIWLAWGSWS